MAKWLESLEAAVGGGPSGPKRVRTLRILFIIGGLGAVLMILNSFLSMSKIESTEQTFDPQSQLEAQEVWNGKQPPSSPFEAIEHSIEMRLKDILEKIVGVGAVSVLVTIDSTEEIVVERNTQESQQVTDENDKGGGKRHITSITKEGQVVLYEVSGDQTPMITKTINPRIRGILIVAKGAENATVRQLITHAVEKGVSVPISRISVVPSKQ